MNYGTTDVGAKPDVGNEFLKNVYSVFQADPPAVRFAWFASRVGDGAFVGPLDCDNCLIGFVGRGVLGMCARHVWGCWETAFLWVPSQRWKCVVTRLATQLRMALLTAFQRFGTRLGTTLKTKLLGNHERRICEYSSLNPWQR